MKIKSLPLYIFGILVAFFLIAPTLVVIPMSFSSGRTLRFPPPGYSLRWYQNLFESPLWTDAIGNSLQLAIATALVATVVGTITALAMSRGKFPGYSIIQSLILSPIIIPAIIIAIGMFSTFVRWGISGTFFGLVIAHTILALPFVVINVMASLRTLDRNLEMAAANLGANPVRTFQHITLPIISPGVFAGALFAFITSWDEIVISIFLTDPGIRTLPVVMWNQVRTEVDPTIAAAATILTTITTLILIISLFLVLERN